MVAAYDSKFIAILRPTYTPAAVPTILTMNAVIEPTRAPSHQPMAPPTVAPMNAKSLPN